MGSPVIGTDRLVRRRSPNVLTVSTSPDFAAKWLVHRLARFAAAYPEIDLRISSTTQHVDLVRDRVDVAIRHGEGHWVVSREPLFPVCSPKLIAGRNRIKQASDLLKFPLLRLEGWSTWAEWFEAARVSTPPVRGPVLNQASMLIDAAIDGQGIALARTTLAAWDLLNGRLVIPIDISMRLQKSYWIVCLTLVAREPKVATFRDWMLAEAGVDTRRLRTLERKNAKQLSGVYVGAR